MINICSTFSRGAILQYRNVSLVVFVCMFFVSVGIAYSMPILYVKAVVNGDMISSLELEHAVSREIMLMGTDPRKNPLYPTQMEDLEEAVLDMLIEEKIILQEAENIGITVPQEYVDAEFEALFLRSGLSEDEYTKQIQDAGLTEDILRDQIKNGIIKQQLIVQNVTRKVIVTEEEVLEYYLTQYDSQSLGKVRVALLMYSSEEAAEQYADLLISGEKDFTMTVKEISIGPNAEDGGDMGLLSKNELAPVVVEAVNTLSVGEVSSTFNLGSSPAQVKLISSQEDKKSLIESIDNQTRRQIEDTLLRPKLEKRMQEYVASLREKAIIETR